MTPENVLGVVAMVREQVQSLRASLQRFRMAHGEGMPMLGSDPVSASAARAFTKATNRLLVKCQDDINALNAVAQGLADAARACGKTEAEITGAFNPDGVAYEPVAVAP